jgi:hypothetical protein
MIRLQITMSRQLAVLMLLLVACGGCVSPTFIPARATAALTTPTSVEAYRVGSLDAHPGYGGKMDGFAVIGDGQMTDDLAKQLAALVLDPSSYRDETRSDEFVPLVGYRFYRLTDDRSGHTSVDVLVSFDADEVLVVARDKLFHENFRRLLESDPSREEWLGLTRQIFPLDVPVQSVPDIRH